MPQNPALEMALTASADRGYPARKSLKFLVSGFRFQVHDRLAIEPVPSLRVLPPGMCDRLVWEAIL